MKIILNGKNIKTILFDLDGTLYKKSNNSINFIRCQVYKLIARKNKLKLHEAKLLYEKLPEKYCNPYEGLSSIGVYPNQYIRIYNLINVKKFHCFDHELIEFFDKLSCEKYVVTLAPKKYAIRVLRQIGILKFFDKKDIISVNKKNNYSKKAIYERILKEKNNLKDYNLLVVGDNYYNDIKPAEELGLDTLLVSESDSNELPLIQQLSKLIKE